MEILKYIFPRVIFLILSVVVLVSADITAQQKQQLLESVKQHLQTEELPIEHQRGYVYQLTLRQIYDQLSPDLQKIAGNQISAAQPVRQKEHISPGGHFYLRYDTSGTHVVPLTDLAGNGVPDFIDSAAAFLDYTWQIEIDELGFQPPMNISGQPAEAYNIYFTNFRSQGYSGLYGSTELEQEIPSLNGENYTSFIELHHNFEENGLYTKGLDGLRVTCAHEFNHAIQVGYRIWFDNSGSINDRYFFEMTSTWLEEVLYSNVNDYFQYLSGLFRDVQRVKFTANSFPYMYANGIFLHMLAERHGIEIVPQIWQQIKKEKAIDALDTVLKEKNSSFANELSEYGKWLYFTGTRAIPGEFFPDAADFSMVVVDPAAQFKGYKNVNFDIEKVWPQSFYYLYVDSIPALRSLAITDASTNNGQLRLNHFNENILDAGSERSGDFQSVVLDFVPQDMVFIVSNARDTLVTANFTFNTDSMIVPDPDSTRTKVAFGPNPAVIKDGRSKHFYAVPPAAEIVILDLNHKPLRKLKNDLNVDAIVEWDMRDTNGAYVSSGVYYFVILAKGKEQLGKIAVVR